MPNYIDGQATAVGGEVHVIIRSVEPEIFDAIQNPYRVQKNGQTLY